MKKENIAIMISIVALIVAMIRCEPITTDWMGVLVGILALLVTALLGWNIYSAIQFDKIINNRLNEVLKKAERKINIALATTQIRVIKGYLANKDWYMAMEGYSSCIRDILNLQDKKMAEDIILLIDTLLDVMDISKEREVKALNKLIDNIKKLSALDVRACDLYKKALEITLTNVD